MMRVILLGALVLLVAWGATARPGRAFSWTMYSGSSKAFLWTDVATQPRVPSYEELGLAPDSHYLTLGDLERLQAESPRPLALEGLILGSRGSWNVDSAGGSEAVAATPAPDGQDVDRLIALLARLGC